MNWKDIVQESSALVKNKETYQLRLGELAFRAYQDRGTGAFEQLAQEIEEIEGIKVSPKTLRNKKWVYESVKGLGIPDDIPYHVLQKIAGSGDVSKWVNLIVEEGYSGAEVARLIMEKRGYKKKSYICESCGKENFT